MNTEVKQLLDQAFHRFLRSNSFEISPESPLYDVVKIAFQVGYGEGGKEAAKRTAELIRKDLEDLGQCQ